MRCLIYSVYSSTDGHGEIAALTQPRIEQYAARVGAYYMRREAKDLVDSVRVKYELGRILPLYDHVLYVDNDIAIANDAPNIFEAFPQEGMRALDESKYFPSRLAHVESRHGAKLTRYFNGGVLLMDHTCAPLFERVPELEMSPPWYEQCHLNIAAANTPFTDIGPAYNLMESIKVPVPTPHFRHAAGMRGEKRLNQLRAWLEQY